MHIPKTAGSSLALGLTESLMPGTVLARGWFDEHVRYSKKIGLHKIRVLIGHITGRELRYFTDAYNVTTSTFLRDPIERVLSNYLFWREQTPEVQVDDSDGNKVLLVDLSLHWKDDLERILTSSEKVWKYRELANVMSWQLATSMYEMDAHQPEAVLELAKSRLRNMGFVGDYATLKTDYEDLVSYLDPSRTAAPLNRVNSTNTETRPVLDADATALISKHNSLDIALYNWAKETLY
jgi:hypothetical protein